MFLIVGFLVSKDRGGGKLVLWDSVSLDRLAPIRGFCLSGACYSNLRAQMAQKLSIHTQAVYIKPILL